jgi:hypothetical protein
LYIALQLNAGVNLYSFNGRRGNEMKRELFADILVTVCVFVLVCALGCSCNAGDSKSELSNDSVSTNTGEESAGSKDSATGSAQPVPVASRQSSLSDSFDIEEWRTLLAGFKIALDEFKTPVSK